MRDCQPGEALEIASRYEVDVPVRVFDLAAELRLGPVAVALPENIAGLLRLGSNGGWTVEYNAHGTRERQGFTVAHEIGHFIFHRDLLGAGVSDTIAYHADEVELPNPNIGREEEWQANNVAAELLIPDAWLRAARSTGINDVKDLARRFEVSEIAMRIRLKLNLPDES